MGKIYTVYEHVNKENGKKYVGITSRGVSVRWKKGYGYSKNTKIRRAFDKYGWENFEHNILYEDVNEETAKEIEKEYIEKYKTQDDEFGYNITSGGDGICGLIHSDNTKKKISEYAKERRGSKNPNYKHKWSKEMKNKASERHKKENLSPETIRKMSESAIKNARKGELNPFYGQKHTEETKRLLSKLRSRSIYMFDKDGNFIREYESINAAAKDFGISSVGISNCCRHVTNSSGGYIWKYKE